MRLSRIFVDHLLDEGVQIQLDADTCHYVKNVLRLKPGTSIALFNGQNCYDYESLLSYEGKLAIATIQNQIVRHTEPVLSTEIIQGLSRSDHMDWMIQKCTELGITRISIFNAMHTQIPLKSAQLNKKLLHWRNIAIKACEQCGRQIPPQVSFQQNLANVIKETPQHTMKILLTFNGIRLPAKSMQDSANQQITVLVGPEGGLSETEVGLAKSEGFIATRLGPRILRTETAAATALAILQYNYGDI